MGNSLTFQCPLEVPQVRDIPADSTDFRQVFLVFPLALGVLFYGILRTEAKCEEALTPGSTRGRVEQFGPFFRRN